MLKTIGRVSFLAVAIVAAGSPAGAQVGMQGVILGTVADKSGAIVLGATVTVRNLDTGLEVSGKTNSAGEFELPALPLGPYSVTATMQGFMTWQLERTELVVSERKRLSITLNLGQITQQVTVTSIAPALQTESAMTGISVERKNILDLPLNTRQVGALVGLTPGIVYQGVLAGFNETFVQGFGDKRGQTNFTLDGSNIQEQASLGAVAMPSVETLGEFTVESADFGAEHGFGVMQVLMSTKSGTNQFHGDLWEFNQNTALNARNAFATTKPKLIQNQWGGTVGGPIIKDKTFFFASLESTLQLGDAIFNDTVIPPAFLTGNFSAYSQPITDPTTGQPFPDNVIPPSRIDSAAKFFFPYLLQPNNPDGRFHGLESLPNNTYNIFGRIDQNLTPKQRIYGHWLNYRNTAEYADYSPQWAETDHLRQTNWGGSYTYTITPTTLLTVSGGYLPDIYTYTAPFTGKTNYTTEAGIQGFPTATIGQQGIGIPTVNISGFTGFDGDSATPYRGWGDIIDGKASLNLILGKHSLMMGYEKRTGASNVHHCSSGCKGNFTFDGQYTGFSVADYMLGLLSSGTRNAYLSTFGQRSIPYDGAYLQDYWKLSQQVTLNLGVRWDFWQERTFTCGSATAYDPTVQKIIAGEGSDGTVHLNCQGEAPYLAAFTQGLWEPASADGLPKGIYLHNGYVSPRLGVAWRVKNNLVVRGSYGIFPFYLEGTWFQSSIIGPPFWTQETPSFSSAQLQSWETAFPTNPTYFNAPAEYGIRPTTTNSQTHEWNVAVERNMPLKSTLTVAYQGNHVFGPVTGNAYNVPPPGKYSSIQLARPFPVLGTVYTYQNGGATWFNGLTANWKRRFGEGLGFAASYAYAKSMVDQAGNETNIYFTPFAPPNYYRGPSAYNRTQIANISGVWDLPVGRGLRFLTDLNRFANGVLGGWELSGILTHDSGTTLNMNTPGATLGNGYSTVPNVVGNYHVAHPNSQMWFDPAGFAAPPAYTFGNAGFDIITGPGLTTLDTALMKNYHFTESKYLQIRGEAFNATNHVNLGAPNVSINQSTTGQIFSAGPARVVQLAMKFYF